MTQTQETELRIISVEAKAIYKNLAPVYSVGSHEELSDLERRVHLLEKHVKIVPGDLSDAIKGQYPISVAVNANGNGIDVYPIYHNTIQNIMPYREGPARIEHVEPTHAVITISEKNYWVYFKEKQKADGM